MHAADTPTNSPRSSVALPLEFQHGSVIVRARVNATNTELSFKLDTGFGTADAPLATMRKPSERIFLGRCSTIDSRHSLVTTQVW